MADGSVDFFDVYSATVVWEGQPRIVSIEAADTEPLIGMSLLNGHRIRIDVIEGGVVRITPLSAGKKQRKSS